MVVTTDTIEQELAEAAMESVQAGDVDTAEEARPLSAASLTFSDDEEEPDWMTQSQFAKVNRPRWSKEEIYCLDNVANL